jgi:putative membrane protein
VIVDRDRVAQPSIVPIGEARARVPIVTRKRFPQSLYGVGSDPDAQVSLANERTFLSWTHLALALVLAGVALEGFDLDLNHGLRLAASIFMIVSGIVVPFVAWFEWMAVERALRLSEPLPGARTSGLLTLVVVVLGLLVLLAVLLR